MIALIKTPEKPLFDLDDRGFNLKAWYLKDSSDALVEIKKDGKDFRKFLFPAYKIYNIAAHFTDIVDSELENNFEGYAITAEV